MPSTRRSAITEESRTPVIGIAKMPAGSSIDVGRANAASILQTMLIEGPLARAEVAERVGLTRGTVTRVTAKLLDIGLLREGTPVRAAFGRPMVPLEISGASRAVITLHLGSSEMRIGLVGLTGAMLHEVKVPYRSTKPQSVVQTLKREVEKVIENRLGTRRLLGVGVSIGGWVDAETGVVVHYPPLAWRAVPLASMLSDALELPLVFDQMVRGMALAEMMFGSARGTQDFVELYIGNVIGAAIVDAGTVRRGPRGGAGIVAHLPVRGTAASVCSCGRADCLESTASDVALLAQATSSGLVHKSAELRDLADLVLRKDARAVALAAENARHLGEASAVIVDLINPELLVLAGLQPTWPGFLDTFKDAFSRSGEHSSNEVHVALSAFGEITPTIASAALFLDPYFRDPFAFDELAAVAL